MEENTQAQVESNDLLEKVDDLHTLVASSKAFYERCPAIRCPFFEGEVTLNADGFNHLLYKPNRQPRNVKAQALKLKLLKKAVRVIQKAGTLQEYRTTLIEHSTHTSSRNVFRINIFGSRFIKNHNIVIWSGM